MLNFINHLRITIRITTRYRYTSVRKIKWKRHKVARVGEDIEELGPSYFTGRDKLVLSAQLLSRVWLFTTPWTVALWSGSAVHGVSQARILEWVAISFSRGSSQPRDRTRISCISSIGRKILLLLEPLGKPHPRYQSSPYSGPPAIKSCNSYNQVCLWVPGTEE